MTVTKPPISLPRSNQDSAWKELLGRFLRPCLAFFFPLIERDIDWSRRYETLDKELAQLRPSMPGGTLYADRLFKVWLKNGESRWLLIHIEIQGRAPRGFARRVFVYNFRIGAQYPGAEVVSLVIVTETKRRVVARHEVANWGCSLVFKFPCAQLADWADRWAELEADDNIFAVAVMAQLKALETRGDNSRRFAWKRRLVRMLYDRGYAREVVVALFDFIDWVMRLPVELEEAIQKEVQEIEEGKNVRYVNSIERLGIREGLRTSVKLLLAHRYGELNEAIQAKLLKLSSEQLEALVVAQMNFQTKSDLLTWLKQNTAASGAAQHPNGKTTKRVSK